MKTAKRSVLEYLRWRGDLPFRRDPFNEVDNLILSLISYLDFSGIVGPVASRRKIRFPEAMAQYSTKNDQAIRLGILARPDIAQLAREAAASPRFQELWMMAYEDVLKEDHPMQFAAVTFRLPDRSLFVAYRGTDDTLVGWKEDFNMAFTPVVPSQARASEYLEEVASHFAGKIRLGGHSKGGNLALWAATHVQPRVRSRIVMAYSNDGPGFTRETLDSEAYRSMEGRLMTFIPESSIVGILLEHDEQFRIIQSAETALDQHRPFSWEIAGTRFSYWARRSTFGQQADARLRAWLASMNRAEREEFVETFFALAKSAEIKTLTELEKNKLRNFIALFSALRGLDKQTQRRFRDILRRLVQAVE